MKTYALTYWFTWAFLVVAAAFTGVASLKDAFFGGLFASGLSALLTRTYVRAGARYAPLLGATAGTLWVVAMFLRLRWFGQPDDFLSAQWTLGIDISVHAAGFAGAGLLVALRERHDFGRALAGGLSLAAAMTAIPYGVIAWIDHRVAGPLEVVLLVNADVRPDEGPVRRVGAVRAELTPPEDAFLKERMLVVDGPGGTEVLDEAGRRYWPLWRRRLIYPGNPGGPVRTLVVLLPPDLSAETWELPVHQEPTGLALAVLGPAKSVRFSGGPASQAVRVELTLAVGERDGAPFYRHLQAEVFRRSPVGDFYAPVPAKGLAPAFPTAAEDAPARPADPVKGRPVRPRFGEPPAAK
ncbi:MAG: hypothetical protein FJ384_01115 [Verrucomicrobia bacterium]|nr:hypothetical protein [Verrucomicrobiota bacterium]